MKRLLVILVVLVMLVACSSEPVEVTRIVETETEVEVTRLVETEVEVTRVVEIPVEVTKVVEIPVEVTRIVEILVEVEEPSSSAAEPTNISNSNDSNYGSRDNPYPIGETATLKRRGATDYEFTLLEVIHDDEAQELLLEVNRKNEPAPEGYEYVVVRAAVKHVGPDSDVLEMSHVFADIISQNRVFGYVDMYGYVYGPEPNLSFDLLSDGYAEGWFARPVPPDPEMVLLIDDTHFDLYGDVVSTDAGETATDNTVVESDEVEVTPTPSQTPEAESISYEDYVDWRGEKAKELALIFESDDDVERVNLVRFSEGVLEIELNTVWASKDRQPEVSWEIVTAFAGPVASGDMDAEWRKKAVNGEDFLFSITTYSTDGDYRYKSETDYDTLVKLGNRDMSYEEWVAAANAGFR